MINTSINFKFSKTNSTPPDECARRLIALLNRNFGLRSVTTPGQHDNDPTLVTIKVWQQDDIPTDIREFLSLVSSTVIKATITCDAEIDIAACGDALVILTCKFAN